MQLFTYIQKVAQKKSLIQIIEEITGYCESDLLKMENEFEEHSFDTFLKCPVKNCDFIAKTHYWVFDHMRVKHQIGIEWFFCPELIVTIRRKENIMSPTILLIFTEREFHGTIVIFAIIKEKVKVF